MSEVTSKNPASTDQKPPLIDSTVYEELIVPYQNAVRVTVAQLQNLREELYVSKTARNPIDSIPSRVKSLESLSKKCIARGVPLDNVNAIKQNIKDIAGIRVLVLYLDDIQRVADRISNIPGISIVEVKDYVAEPKENGYQSLHLIVQVQIPSFEHGNQNVFAEIQIRTLAMQYWSQVEHRSRYKAKTKPGPEVAEMLRQTSEIMRQADELFVKIRLACKDD